MGLSFSYDNGVQHLESHDGALVLVVEAAAQHHALAAQLALDAIEEKVLLLMRLPEGVFELRGHSVMGLLVGQPQLDLHLRANQMLLTCCITSYRAT